MATKSVEAPPVRLRLVVRAVGRDPADVELEAYADSRAGAVVEALANELGVDPDGVRAFCPRNRAWLEEDQELGALGLCQGDELVLSADGSAVEPVTPRPATAFDLAVVGGPESGRRLPLVPGEHLLGRDSSCAFAIDDPSLSAEHVRLTVSPEGEVSVADNGSRNGTAVEGVALTEDEQRPLADDWRPARSVRSIPGLRLANPIDLVSRDESTPGELVAGMDARAEGPTLLPPGFRSELSRAPKPETVRLGTLPALRYRGLQHRQLGAALTLYVVPADRGGATIACLGPTAGPSAVAGCESVAASISLRGAYALPLGPDPRYGATVRPALRRLSAARLAGREALRVALTPAAQARAAARLEAAFAAAAKILGKAKPGPLTRPAHRELLAAVARAEGGYRALAVAAQAGNGAVYRVAALRIERAEKALDAAIHSLAAIGYRVEPAG